MKTIKTLKLRIKDKHSKVLVAMARDVNQVFNFANETSSRAIRERGKWLSAYDLQKLTAGYSNWAAHTHCERWQGWQARAARAPADSVLEAAACWPWIAEYLVGTRTDLDDGIVASETVNDLRKLVDAARKQGGAA